MAARLIQCRQFCSPFSTLLFSERQTVFRRGPKQALGCWSCNPGQHRDLHSSGPIGGGRLKSEWRRKRAPALTRLCLGKPEKLKKRKAFGGGEKTKVTRAKEGSYIWQSQDVAFQVPILDVLYNSAHKDFTDRKIMVKGTIVEVDGEQFKTWFDKVCNINDEKKDKERSSAVIDDRVLDQLRNGKVLAKVSSRPGQEGKVDGYLLEGDELDFYHELVQHEAQATENDATSQKSFQED